MNNENTKTAGKFQDLMKPSWNLKKGKWNEKGSENFQERNAMKKPEEKELMTRRNAGFKNLTNV